MGSDELAPTWAWQDDAPIDLSGYTLRPFPRAGDSAMWTARQPRPPRRRTPMPILYLVKGGRDAIAERLSYLLARLLDLPLPSLCLTPSGVRARSQRTP